MKIKIPTAKQYQAVVEKLSDKHFHILETLYYSPDSSATAKQLADKLGYKGFQGASRQIGAIGEIFYHETGIKPSTYSNNGEQRPAFFRFVGDYTKENGWKMWPELKMALKNSGRLKEQEIPVIEEPLPTEFDAAKEEALYEEGKVIEVLVNRYERNREAREECIRHYGSSCQGCGFNFEKVYGEVAKDFIHVHHLIPLAQVGKAYKVNPETDLIPLCANCHSVVHLAKPMMTIEELKKSIDKM